MGEALSIEDNKRVFTSYIRKVLEKHTGGPSNHIQQSKRKESEWAIYEREKDLKSTGKRVYKTYIPPKMKEGEEKVQ